MYFNPTVKTVGYWFLLIIAIDYHAANGFSIADGFNRRITGLFKTVGYWFLLIIATN